MHNFNNVSAERPYLEAAQRGYSLLELIVVILIMSFVSAMVIPNFFDSQSNGLARETNRLQRVLVLAQDEVVMTGMPIRWVGRKNGYWFESPDSAQKWKMISEKPFQHYIFSTGVWIDHILELSLQDGFQVELSAEESQDHYKDTLGKLTFLPDIAVMANILMKGSLVNEGEINPHLSIELRPGAVSVHSIQ